MGPVPFVIYNCGSRRRGRRHFNVSICISSTFVHAIYIIIFDGWIIYFLRAREFILEEESTAGKDGSIHVFRRRLVRFRFFCPSVLLSFCLASACEGLFFSTTLIQCLCLFSHYIPFPSFCISTWGMFLLPFLSFSFPSLPVMSRSQTARSQDVPTYLPSNHNALSLAISFCSSICCFSV
jgi:hypothetical protein